MCYRYVQLRRNQSSGQRGIHISIDENPVRSPILQHILKELQELRKEVQELTQVIRPDRQFVETMLRRRGFSVVKYAPIERLVLPPDCSQETEGEFYRLMKKYSFRIKIDHYPVIPWSLILIIWIASKSDPLFCVLEEYITFRVERPNVMLTNFCCLDRTFINW